MPENVKLQINKWAESHVEKLRSANITKKPPKNQNYVADVYYEWTKDRFYLCAKYNSQGPRAISPYFIEKFARLEHIGNDHYQLFAMRHTGNWMPIEVDMPLETCINSMEHNPWFRLW